MKICSTCKISKPESEFYKDKRTKDGLKYQCKHCHLESSIRTRDLEKKRKANKEYMKRARTIDAEKFRYRERNYIRTKNERVRARTMLNSAVRAGIIIKPLYCEECGNKKRLTAHHDDYFKPFQVRWLCYECHGKQYRKIS